MDRTTLSSVLNQLVELGWLDPAERAGKAHQYRLSDAGRIHPTFLFNVDQYKKRREEAG
jgi:hypothetical protein